eukprot:11245682-Heterocapsa_arctica.AAC.1
MVNALLSGLETCVMTDLELRRLEGFSMRQLRVLLHGRAARQTNRWARVFAQCPTLASLLQARRIRWLQVLLATPTEDVPLLVAVTGSRLAAPSSAGLSREGVPTTCAKTWLKQWWCDLRRVAALCPEVAAALSDRRWFSLPL